MQVVVDTLLTHYEVAGKGKTIVLLHGWGDTMAGVRGLAEALKSRYRVLLVDLPGFGGTQAPTGVWGLDDYAQFLRDLLDKIDEKKIFAVIGHSNGGAIAIRGLSAETFTADKLVLLASAGIRGEYKGRMRALKYLTKAGKVLASPLPKAVQRRLRHRLYKTVGSDLLVAEHLQESFKKVVAQDVRADAAKLSVPVLLIYGDQDGDTPVWYGEAFHQAISGSTLEILPGAGHFVHIDRGDDVERAVKDFLK
jgi:pimeloyl-ACP methyl ester carboxylesterase